MEEARLDSEKGVRSTLARRRVKRVHQSRERDENVIRANACFFLFARLASLLVGLVPRLCTTFFIFCRLVASGHLFLVADGGWLLVAPGCWSVSWSWLLEWWFAH